MAPHAKVIYDLAMNKKYRKMGCRESVRAVRCPAIYARAWTCMAPLLVTRQIVVSSFGQLVFDRRSKIRHV